MATSWLDARLIQVRTPEAEQLRQDFDVRSWTIHEYRLCLPRVPAKGFIHLQPRKAQTDRLGFWFVHLGSECSIGHGPKRTHLTDAPMHVDVSSTAAEWYGLGMHSNWIDLILYEQAYLLALLNLWHFFSEPFLVTGATWC